jgi:hypothetical protein
MDFDSIKENKIRFRKNGSYSEADMNDWYWYDWEVTIQKLNQDNEKESNPGFTSMTDF